MVPQVVTPGHLPFCIILSGWLLIVVFGAFTLEARGSRGSSTSSRMTHLHKPRLEGFAVSPAKSREEMGQDTRCRKSEGSNLAAGMLSTPLWISTSRAAQNDPQQVFLPKLRVACGPDIYKKSMGFLISVPPHSIPESVLWPQEKCSSWLKCQPQRALFKLQC